MCVRMCVRETLQKDNPTRGSTTPSLTTQIKYSYI